MLALMKGRLIKAFFFQLHKYSASCIFIFLGDLMFKKLSIILLAFTLQFAIAQQSNTTSGSSTAGTTTSAGAAGAATAGVTTATIVGAAAAALAVAAAISSSKADPVYTYSNTTGTTVTICIANC
jgi:hypothetical protein